MPITFYTKIPHCPSCMAMINLLKKYNIEYVENSDTDYMLKIKYIENEDHVKYVADKAPQGFTGTACEGFKSVPWLELEDGQLLTLQDAIRYYRQK